MMEWQIALFCVLFVLVSFFIYMILSGSTYKEDSFEEAKANRRKIMKQFQDENKVSSEKSKEKKTKKANKKVRDKKDPTNDMAESESRDSAIESDNGKELEQIQSEKSSSTLEGFNEPKLEIKVKDKKKFVQSTQEHQQHSDSGEIEILLQENKHLNTLKIPLEKVSKEHKKKKKDADKDKEVERNSELCQESTLVNSEKCDSDLPQVAVQNSLQTTASRSTSVNKPSKKKRAEITSFNQLKNEKEAVSINLLASLIQKAELSRSEIQVLIDALLNKQQDDVSEWLKGRQDPVVKLRKQLADGEQALKDEKEVNTGLQAKLKELRAELTNDRATLKSSEDLVVSLKTEIKALSHKLHITTEEKHGLAVNMQQFQKQLNEEKLKLKEEHIKQRVTEEQSHETVLALQAKIAQLSDSLQENIEKYQKLQENLLKMTRGFEGAQFNVRELQGELKSQERALTDAKTEIENLIVTNKSLHEQNEHLSSQVKSQCQEINILKEKNESLAKINAENWENGFSYSSKQELADLEARLEEKRNQLEQLKNELEFTRNKVQELNVSLTRSKNDFGKSQMLLDKANSEILLLKEKVSDAARSLQEDSISQLKTSLTERNKEITLLKNEIDVCKQKNNSLRNKNWKIVEALSKAETALQSKIRKEQNSNEQTSVEDKGCTDVQKIYGTVTRLMKHLYPDITVEDYKTSLDEWLANLEEAVMNRTMNGTEKLNSPELQAHNNHLQALVVQYKGIITDTEGMLNQIQKHVELQDAQWQAKITSLEEEITQLRSNSRPEMLLQS